MGSNKTTLYSEFKSVSLAEWETKILKDLKGKPLDILHFKPEFDLQMKAYYHPEEFSDQIHSKGEYLNNDNNDWAISESYIDTDSKVTNKAILKSLNEGVGGVKITITPLSNLGVLFSEVLIEHLFTHIICTNIEDCDRLTTYLDKVNKKVSIIEIPILTQGVKNGKFDLDQTKILDYIQKSVDYCSKNILINGHVFCQFGASSAQELGIALSQLNEYFQYLSDNAFSLELLKDKVAFHLGVTDNYFTNVSKFRAIKELVLQLTDQWGLKINTVPWVSAETVIRHLTKNDRHNNVLRQTSSAMAAVLGGVNQLIVKPYSEVTENDTELSARLAKNIQLILKDEAYFHHVIDPSAGAYAIESLTDQLIEKSWSYFMDIEKRGGYYEAIKDGTIHTLIETSKNTQIEALNSNEKTLLGVNKFQNSAEVWKTVAKKGDSKNIEFRGFTYFNLEQNFEK